MLSLFGIRIVVAGYALRFSLALERDVVRASPAPKGPRRGKAAGGDASRTAQLGALTEEQQALLEPVGPASGSGTSSGAATVRSGGERLRLRSTGFYESQEEYPVYEPGMEAAERAA